MFIKPGNQIATSQLKNGLGWLFYFPGATTDHLTTINKNRRVNPKGATRQHTNTWPMTRT